VEELLGRPRSRWENTIIVDLREMGWEGVDWMHVAENVDQWRVHMIMVMDIGVP
jgi:hypothetical protein